MLSFSFRVVPSIDVVRAIAITNIIAIVPAALRTRILKKKLWEGVLGLTCLFLQLIGCLSFCLIFLYKKLPLLLI